MNVMLHIMLTSCKIQACRHGGVDLGDFLGEVDTEKDALHFVVPAAMKHCSAAF